MSVHLSNLSRCSFSLSHSVLECLQKASILEHSFPDLNPTSDYFILHDHWNSPILQLICLYQLAETLGVNFLCISVLFHLDYTLNFYLYLVSSCITSQMMKYFILILLLMCFFFHQKLDGPFKVKVTKYLFRTSFSHLSLPECLPFLSKGSWMLLLLCPFSTCSLSLSPRNILQGCTHFILVWFQIGLWVYQKSLTEFWSASFILSLKNFQLLSLLLVLI